MSTRGRGRQSGLSPYPSPKVCMFGLVDDDMKSVEHLATVRAWCRRRISRAWAGNGAWCRRSLASWTPTWLKASTTLPHRLQLPRIWLLLRGGLDVRSNTSYAFNMFYQMQNQQRATCQSSNLATVTIPDPLQDILIWDYHRHLYRAWQESSATQGGDLDLLGWIKGWKLWKLFTKLNLW